MVGGAGFLGRHLVKRLLSEGFYVRLIDRDTSLIHEEQKYIFENQKLTVEQADILHLPLDDRIFEGVDEYFQCVVNGNHRESLAEPEPHIYPNLMPTVHLLGAARLNPGVRLHQISSSAVYGNVSGSIHEGTDCEAETAYGLVKILQEQAVDYWHRTFGIPTIIYRPFLCYGLGDNSGGVVSTFLKKFVNGEPLTLYGKGDSGRDFIHINDLVDAIIMATGTNINRGIYNVGSGELTTIKKLAELFGVEIKYAEPRVNDHSSYANIDQIKKDLKWTAKTPLEKGIAEIMGRSKK